MRKHLPRLLLLLLLAALLYFALRNAPLTEIWSTLRQLRLWQIAALMGVNAGIYALFTLRWWIITQAEAKRVPYFPLLLVRVAVFGVSYFTLGPQVGGEPLQALALRRRYGLTYTRATATVLMDKLLEFLANFVLLAFGLAAIFEAGILPTNGSRPIVSLIGIVLLLAWPPIHIILLRRGGHPISSILRVFPKRKATRFLAASERMAGAFCRRHFKALLAAVFVSLLGALGMVGDVSHHVFSEHRTHILAGRCILDNELAGVPRAAARRTRRAGSQPGFCARRVRRQRGLGARRDPAHPRPRPAHRRAGITFGRPRNGKVKNAPSASSNRKP